MVEFDSKENIEIDNIEVGSLVKGTVVNVREDEVFVDIGYKAEGIISKNDLAYPTPEKASDIVEAGQIIDVYVIAIEDAEGGSVKLSKIKADQIQAWLKLERAFASGETLEGIVQEIVKGGITVAVCGLRGFVPASHIDLNHVDDLNQFIGQTILMKPIEVIPDNKKLVLSRRKYLLEQKLLNEQKVMDSLAVNQIVKGTVSRITNFGAFVNLGGIDGLIHVSDLAWHRVKSANEIVNIGDEVEVVVLNIDHNQRKIALSLKQATRDPWFDKAESLSVGSLVAGTVSKTAKFGAFVTLKDGLEGLIHLSELAEDRVNNVEDVVSVGDQITVKVLEVDKKNKKIRLSLSQAKQEQERSEYQQYLSKDDGFGMTIGDKFKHLFKTEN